ncbi:hypothetical protein CISG_02939 [Coccidioides immitis RMSCC 3703]|uniref:Rhodopsin domain-containing protein n=1 Tax=Coccidioides immitis RMSCC 3703 TaxID=454286 RepID=A0A0J8QIK8_COCIT|nr:hypothetical protein CISG_02939 [Coccidioides immitis RMSCC 3703]
MAQTLITDTDKSALVDIFVWIFLVIAVLSVIASTSTKIAIRGRPTTEDYIILVALAFCIGQSITVGIQNQNGWGRYTNTLSESQLQTVLKGDYAASFLFITSICLTKIALLVLSLQFALLKQYKYTIYALGTIVILWTMSSMFVVGFQCRLPEPWNYVNNICVGRFAKPEKLLEFLWGDEHSDRCYPSRPMITITSQIQTSQSANTIGSVLEPAYLLWSCGFTAVLSHQVPDTSNATFDYWQMTICTQILQSLAVVTACMPFLKPFLDSLESGLLRADDQYRRSTAKGSYRYNLSGSKSSARRAARREAGEFNELGVLSSNHGRARNGHGSQVESGGVDWDESNSQSSQSRIIKETRTFTVDVELRERDNF